MKAVSVPGSPTPGWIAVFRHDEDADAWARTIRGAVVVTVSSVGIRFGEPIPEDAWDDAIEQLIAEATS